MRALRTGLLPRVRLSDEAFRSRHRALRLVLWIQVPLLTLLGVLNDGGGHVAAGHAALAIPLMAVALAGCAFGSLVVTGRRPGSFLVSLGLLLCAALLVTLGGGRTELHFAFFLTIGLISLYQDWLPLALSVVLVVVQHLLVGHVAPTLLYSDPPGTVQFITYAAVHGGFVLGGCAVQIVYWRFTERAQAETDRVRIRYEALVQDASDVTAVVDKGGRIVSISAAVQRVLGHRPETVVGRGFDALVHPEHVALLRGALSDGREEHRAEVRIRHADGDWRWHEMALRDMTGHTAVAGWVINHRDVTERRQAQDRLAYEASHDALTGLANRAELLRTLEREAARDSGIAVLFLDLDGFKQVNDVYGHETGDRLLTSVARSLRRSVLGSDTVGRLGGDEFAVVLTQIEHLDEAVTVATRILAELSLPVDTGGTVIVPGASIGIAMSAPGCRADLLLRQADTAMYHAKRDGCGWRTYVEGMHDPDAPVATLEDDLRRAVADEQLRLSYQPVVSLLTGEITEVEALVRWEHPVHGRLLPEAFVPLAEQTGLIDEIGRWVLEEACRQVTRWQHRHGPLRLGVNLSPHQLTGPESVADLLTVLEDTGFDPADLTAEIAEHACVNAPDLVAGLTALRAHGVRIALDDFGTGHSSLRHLTRLPVDVLKLDQCFVSELDGTQAGSAVAEAVIRLGRILELETVAEGVETPAQAAELTLLGCRSGQGFLYAHPLDPVRMDELLSEHRSAAKLS